LLTHRGATDKGKSGAGVSGCDRKSLSSDNAYTLIDTAELNGVDPQARLTDVLVHISDHMVNRIAELLPSHYAEPSA
jgi:hypothetical protein